MDKPKTSFKLITAKEAAEELRDYTEKRSTGEIKSLLTPWNSLNKRGINGLEWCNIITFAGMSGCGKTALASILEDSLFELNPDENFACLNISLEMKAHKLMGRKASSKLNITTSELYSANTPFKEKEKLDKIIEEISKRELFYLEDYTTATGIKNLFVQLYSYLNPDAKDKSINEHKGLVLFLDHSILVQKEKGKDRLEALQDLCEAFNDLKKKHKGLFIILSQLNRSIEASERRDEYKNQILHFPTKADIYGGDSLYQFSDIVMIIHRPEIPSIGLVTYGPDNWLTKDRIFFHYLKVREEDPGIAICKNNLKNNQIIEL